MRHTNTGLSEDDLSRLTGSSSSTSSCGGNSSSSSSSSSSSTAANTCTLKVDSVQAEKAAAAHHHHHQHHQQINQKKQHSPEKISSSSSSSNNNNNNNNNINNNKNSNSHSQKINNSTRFSSTYLPEFINPLEWQKSRKRKDSTSSSAAQERKLQRSNSEELVPQDTTKVANKATAGGNVGGGNALKAPKTADLVIRRVSSEDFKKSSYASYEQDLKESNGGDVSEQHSKKRAADENDASLANRQKQQAQNYETPSLLSSIYRETSSGSCPVKDLTRHTRYETSPMRSQRHSPIRGNGSSNGGKHRDSDESDGEHERRRNSERFCKSRAPPGRKAVGVTKKSSSSCGSGAGKYISSKRNDENVYKYDLSALKYERRGFISKKVGAATASDHNDNNLIDFHQQKASESASDETKSNTPTTPTAVSVSAPKRHSGNVPQTIAQEALPWDRSVQEDYTPMLSRRYAPLRDNIDTAAKLSKVMPYPQQFHKQTAAKILADDLDSLTPLSAFRAFTSLENLRTREVLQQVIPAMMSFQSPEQRLKQVNKRLTAMKKKLSQLEEAYESRMGYRPSQAERLNDKYMRNIVAELTKLRKERHELKSDPMGAVGIKISGGMNSIKKLENMKTTLYEIEQNLTDKREDCNRSDTLDELTADQLVQEKTAVQHGLLYFESLYGRPNSKDERDVARPLYDRYRQLKRMVSRSVTLSSAAAGAPELPTILEHEAMVFESTPLQYSSNNSTETTNSPSDVVAAASAAAIVSSDESTATTTTTAAAQQDTNENISDLSIGQLWEQLDKNREEKRQLKRIIHDFETVFEEQNGRKMLKSDRKAIEETYAQYKEKKAKTRLLQALIKKHISH